MTKTKEQAEEFIQHYEREAQYEYQMLVKDLYSMQEHLGYFLRDIGGKEAQSVPQALHTPRLLEQYSKWLGAEQRATALRKFKDQYLPEDICQHQEKEND